MRRILIAAGLLLVAAAVVLQSVHSGPEPAQQPEKSGDKVQPAADRSADEVAIKANIDKFVKAYNSHDAKAIAALFTPDGVIVDKEGDETQGQEAIAKAFTEIFKASPKKKVEVSVESIRFLDANLAIEVGTTKESDDSNEPPEIDRYTVLHVKRDGKWLMALARDEEGPLPTPHEHLKPLAWLVGDWVDDGGSTVVVSSCRWSEDGHFLLQEFKLKISGKDSMNVSQRIGWDPHRKCIHSWTFDSEGGFGESTWTRDDDDSWIIKATGVRPDGTTASATNQLTQSGANGYLWQSRDRIVAGDVQDPVEVKVVRKAPEPKK